MTEQFATHHAHTRMRQRGIPPIVTHWLGEFGEEYFDGRGGIVRYFSRGAKRRLERAVGRQFVAENSRYLDRYIVESTADGALITVGVLTRPIRHR